MSLNIREIEERDLIQLNSIYNHATGLGYATAHLVPLPVDYHVKWFKEHKNEQNPILVVCDGDTLLGWNALSHYRGGRQALNTVRETSYYVHKDHWGKGIATLLMKKMIEKAKNIDVHTLVTFIMDRNITSVQLMEKFGFELWGRLPGVLHMPGGNYDHLIFGKKIS